VVVGANKPPRSANREKYGVEAQALWQPPRPVANTRGLASGTTTSSAMNQARPLGEPALYPFKMCHKCATGLVLGREESGCRRLTCADVSEHVWLNRRPADSEPTTQDVAQMCHRGVLRDGTARSCPRPLSSGNDVWGRSDLNRRPTDFEGVRHSPFRAQEADIESV
jgi:hypothetical protein